jgi:hypothetical protein
LSSRLQSPLHSNYKSTGFHHFISWIDIAHSQLIFQLKNERAGFSSLIFRKVFQLRLNEIQSIIALLKNNNFWVMISKRLVWNMEICYFWTFWGLIGIWTHHLQIRWRGQNRLASEAIDFKKNILYLKYAMTENKNLGKVGIIYSLLEVDWPSSKWVIFIFLTLDFCRFNTEFHQRNTVFEQKLINFQLLKLGK